MRIVHVYSMRDDPDRVHAVAPAHAAYWRDLRLPGYLGGPFADRSGGVITFEASSFEDAVRVIDGDPFVREQLLETSLVKQWVVE